ncbi:DUF72 domain-containing protein [Salinimicrobium sp. TH3]|uniref:DUF72 domain-containing protein n=1 Tax=Salinimicrobium sp. TH3 TaxID=2997342 RepID=UPI0022768A9E|nr:DUF72 domain-containing protein [Salinimicrobium sp. TH3]MCY2687392.1 DUF72 domain-containing protein [Salinimicrobium sp. TH3]
MKLYIGCSGWNYRDWRGKFYPEKLAQKNWLDHYSGEFNTVEINSTFYRFPQDKTVEKWRDTVPEDFKFTLKGSRYITHMKKLNDVEESVGNFNTTSGIMGHKLGNLLWQLPPSVHRNDERLLDFIKLFDKSVNNVIEFRHESWYDEEVYALLRKQNVIFCAISSPRFPEEMITTSETGYLRFHGKGKKWYDYYYSEDELQEWAHMIRNSGLKEIYIYFNNDIHANAPENAKQLLKMLED